MPNAKRNLDRLQREAAKRGPDALRTYEDQIKDAFSRLRHMEYADLFCEERLGFHPDPWQRRLLRSDRRKIIVNVARQQGKSTTAAAKALHRALFWPKSLILIVAPAVPQAQELRRKIDEHVRTLKTVSLKTVTENKREMEFENGSRIIILAADEDTVRSYTAHMIIEDEAAMVPDPVYEAMEPMLLVTGGQHILLGTPKGLRTHHFPDIWHSGSNEIWDKYEVNAWSNPRVPKNQIQALKDEKERLGRLWWFQQEYECSFVAAAQGLVYPYEPRRNASPRLPLDRRHGWQYVLGIDYGYSDSTAFVVLGWQANDPNVYVIESLEKRGLTPSQAADVALEYTRKYPFARIVGDTGGLGKGYVEEARRRFKLPIQPAEKNNKRGYVEIMAGDMKAGLLKVFPGNEGLVEEWQKLPWDEEREMPADGYKDHLADAALYGYRATLHYLEEIRKPGPKPGTKEAYDAEAEAMLEQRIQEVIKKDIDWWDEREPQWLDENQGTPFLN